METLIIIKDGTSKTQLCKAIKNYEKHLKTTVLKFFVDSEHNYILVDFNGIIISKWFGNVDEFINEVNVDKMRLLDLT